MRVLLLYARFNEKVTYRVPLGIAYLGSVLRDNNIEVLLREGAFYQNWSEFKQDIRKIKPDIIGISATSFLIANAFNYAKVSKVTLPDCKVIMGGPHATVMPEDILNKADVDVIVYGEGEETILELTQNINKNLRDIKGIVYKQNGEVIKNPPRPWIDMDKRRWPARDLLPMNRYLGVKPTLPIPYPATDIEVSRGCFHNCLFCQPVLRKMFGPRVRNRNPQKVVDEICYLINKYRIKGLNLGNDEPLINKEWTHNLCDELIKRKVSIKLNAPCRVDNIDQEMLNKMKKAGFIHLSFGVESGSQLILNKLRKGVTIEKIKNAFKMCEKAGICGRANLMVGSPWETPDTIKQTINLIHQVKPDLIYLAAVTPTPGTDLYMMAKKENILRIKDFADFKAFDAGYLKLKDLTTDEIHKSIIKISRVFKMELLNYCFNFSLLYKKRYLFKILFAYFWSLLKNPKELFGSLIYSFTYGRHIKKIK